MVIAHASPSAMVTRLTASLVLRGHSLAASTETLSRAWLLGPEDDPETAGTIEREGRSRGDHILVLGWNGTHPDARAEVLGRLWRLEERCRATMLPVLTLRLGPLVGPASPLWRKLAESMPEARLARKLMHPVLETDVVEAIDRALQGKVAWEGWQEIGGPDVMSLGELAALARASRPPRGGEWEPDPAALAEQRLIEPGVWAQWSGIDPGSVATEAARWAA